MIERNKILESWKEIASYLNRSETTCRRLERELGLPIHRLEETPKARVFAYTEEIDRWIRETRHSEKEFPLEKPLLKKLSIPVVIVTGLLISALIIWQLLLQNKKNTNIIIPPDKPSLAVLYFKNNTGDSSLDIWRKTLAESLIRDLHQSKYITVLREDRLFTILKKLNLLEAQNYTTEELIDIASEGQIDHLLLGSFSKAGDVFRIETTLQDIISGVVIDSERVEGKGEENFFPMIDKLTRRIKSGLNISPRLIRADIDRDIEEITTSSPIALKYYTEGLQYRLTGDIHTGITFLEKAVAVDPNFAMAYRAMGAAYYNLGNVEKQREYNQKAMEHSDRVSDRERHIILGAYYSESAKTWDKAIEEYQKLLELYPDEITGNSSLPTLYSRIGNNEKAIEFSEKARQHHPESTVVFCNSAYFYFTEGMYDKAEDILKDYESHVSENSAPIKLFLAFSFLFRNKYDPALSEIEKSLSLIPSFQASLRTKGDLHLFMGDFSQAEREYRKLLEKEESIPFGRARLGALYLLLGKISESGIQVEKGLEQQRILGRNSMIPDFYLQLAYRYLKTGDNEKALELTDEALKYAVDMERLDWQMWVLYFKGLTFIAKNSMEETKRTADELKRLAEESLNEKDIRWHFHLLGLIDLERKNFSSAVEHFEKAISLLNFEGHWCDDLHALFYEPLARAYYESGELEAARREYEKIVSLTKGRLYYGNIYAKSFYVLGDIFERLGEKGKAIENYEKFLDLWKDADPDFYVAQDAKKRLADLKIQ